MSSREPELIIREKRNSEQYPPAVISRRQTFVVSFKHWQPVLSVLLTALVMYAAYLATTLYTQAITRFAATTACNRSEHFDSIIYINSVIGLLPAPSETCAARVNTAIYLADTLTAALAIFGAIWLIGKIVNNWLIGRYFVNNWIKPVEWLHDTLQTIDWVAYALSRLVFAVMVTMLCVSTLIIQMF